MGVPDFTTLELERRGHVLRVTIAHPTSALNAVDDALHRDLTALFAFLRREDDARCVLLTGRGRAFSAGGDFAWFPELRAPGRMEALRRDAKQLIWDLLDVEVPIVAALNGHAMGLGASIALLCDVIFMADTATIGDPHVRVGIVAGDGGAVIWPLAVGPARAKQYLLTGDPLGAAEGERIGLINRVVPAVDLDREAMAFAERLAGRRAARRALHQAGGEQARQGCAQRRIRRLDGARARDVPERGPPGGPGGAAREARSVVQGP